MRVEFGDFQKIRLIGDYQFGKYLGKELFPSDVKIVYSKRTGRIRHVYISKQHRRKGFAKMLLTKILEIEKTHFDTIRLLTTNPAAVCLYESFDFVKITKEINASHIFLFDKS